MAGTGGMNERLLSSAERGDVQKIKDCLRDGADPNFCDVARSRCPLSLATIKGHKDVVQLLLEKGADCNLTLNLGPVNTPFLIAIVEAWPEICTMFLQKGANPDMYLGCGSTPLMMAFRVDFSARYERYLGSATAVSLFLDDSDQVIRVLLQAGADPSKPHRKFLDVGISPITLAMEALRVRAFHILLTNGANPNGKFGDMSLDKLASLLLRRETLHGDTCRIRRIQKIKDTLKLFMETGEADSPEESEGRDDQRPNEEIESVGSCSWGTSATSKC